MTAPDTPTNHPLTETAAAELWGDTPFIGGKRLWRQMDGTMRRRIIAAMRAAYDAGREHEHEHATPAHVTDEMVQAGHAAALGRSMGSTDTYRRIITAALAAAPTPADPHHDTRPWQDCTRKDIREGDLVETWGGDTLRIGVAHHQDAGGNWRTKDNRYLTNGDHWPLRRIPAPTPPAEVVELPSRHPAHITDVEGVDGDVCSYMAKSRYSAWFGVDQDGDTRRWVPRCIDAFTLPDGTRARRHGEREDGTPRFVKVQEEEK